VMRWVSVLRVDPDNRLVHRLLTHVLGQPKSTEGAWRRDIRVRWSLPDGRNGTPTPQAQGRDSLP
jgi:hypothetical protein